MRFLAYSACIAVFGFVGVSATRLAIAQSESNVATESVVGTTTTILAIAVAFGIFIAAWLLVKRARRGNAKTRERRHDPHADDNTGRFGPQTDSHRDIPQ